MKAALRASKIGRVLLRYRLDDLFEDTPAERWLKLARRLQTLAERFDPDWQQPFVAVFGEIIGVQVANAARNALRELRQASGNLAQNAAEFVTEESRDVVGRAELNAFHDDVDALRDDVERLHAKVERLRGAKA